MNRHHTRPAGPPDDEASNRGAAEHPALAVARNRSAKVNAGEPKGSTQKPTAGAAAPKRKKRFVL
jgi:hypothetical protein